MVNKYRVLIVHNMYQIRGGEDRVVNMEASLLAKHGHEVDFFYKDNQTDIHSFFDKLSVIKNLVHSSKVKHKLKEHIKVFKPDIVHFHNIFPQITASAYDACEEMNVPFVQTLHNYRVTCANALLLRDEKICEQCLVKQSFLPSIKYGCYKNSRIATIPVAWMLYKYKSSQVWQKKVKHYIALSDFSRRKFIQAGIPQTSISIKPNFFPEECIHKEEHERVGALFVGRLSQEKGINVLLSAFRKVSIPIFVIGEGQFDSNISIPHNIKLLGKLPPERVYEYMARSKLLIFPSICYENFSLTLVEAFAHGLPVIASNMGSIAEIVKHEENGLLFKPNDASDLLLQVQRLLDNEEFYDKISRQTYETYLTKYTAEKNYQDLMDCYSKLGEDDR